MTIRWTHLLASAAPLALAIAAPAQAQSAQDIADLRAEIAALRAEQAESKARIAQLEAQRDAARTVAQASPASAAPSASPVVMAAVPSQGGAAAPVNPAGGSAPGVAPAPVPSRLALNGDVRVRYESNFGLDNVRDRDRLVLRARLRGTYAINKWLAIGGQIATGDNDDPNTTDITLANFDDDLTVALDQAYLRGMFGGLTVYGGKIPQPFARTELVWDGDVSPQGVSGSYKVPLGKGSLKANGLYFIIDDAVSGRDSRMFGGQLQAETNPSAPVKFEIAAGYYDYHLPSTAGGDAGDFRTNRFAAGRYLSDFNLLDVIGAVQFNGLGERWPVRLVGDYVHNYGAIDNQDTGFGIDLLLGRGNKLHDWRFGYGYAETEVDAVLTAFSHDNTNLASNYLQHTLLVDYVIAPNVILNATWYHYRAKDARFTTAFSPTDWADRVRLNFLANF